MCVCVCVCVCNSTRCNGPANAIRRHAIYTYMYLRMCIHLYVISI